MRVVVDYYDVGSSVLASRIELITRLAKSNIGDQSSNLVSAAAISPHDQPRSATSLSSLGFSKP